jgi:hypothetical protein
MVPESLSSRAGPYRWSASAPPLRATAALLRASASARWQGETGERVRASHRRPRSDEEDCVPELTKQLGEITGQPAAPAEVALVRGSSTYPLGKMIRFVTDGVFGFLAIPLRTALTRGAAAVAVAAVVCGIGPAATGSQARYPATTGNQHRRARRERLHLLCTT